MCNKINKEGRNIFEDQSKIKRGVFFPISLGAGIESLYEGVINSRYPIFVLRSNDNKIRKYQDEKIEILLKPSFDGLATIFDKDVWIYSIQKLKEFFKGNEEVSGSIVRFSPCKFFSAAYRNSGGKNYHLLKKSLSRLNGTIMEISVFYSSGKKEIREISFIESWKISYKKIVKLYSEIVEVKMPNWIARYILSNKKTIFFEKEYYLIRKAIVRRLYEIVKVNCVGKKEYSVNLKDLFQMVGTTCLLKTFRYKIRNVERENNIPGYNIQYDPISEVVYFLKKDQKIFLKS